MQPVTSKKQNVCMKVGADKGPNSLSKTDKTVTVNTYQRS